jgi:hypothetical protein
MMRIFVLGDPAEQQLSREVSTGGPAPLRAHALTAHLVPLTKLCRRCSCRAVLTPRAGEPHPPSLRP